MNETLLSRDPYCDGFSAGVAGGQAEGAGEGGGGPDGDSEEEGGDRKRVQQRNGETVPADEKETQRYHEHNIKLCHQCGKCCDPTDHWNWRSCKVEIIDKVTNYIYLNVKSPFKDIMVA